MCSTLVEVLRVSNKQVTSIRVDPEIWRKFKEVCKKHKRTASGVLRELILSWIEVYDKMEPPQEYKIYTLPAKDNSTKLDVICECGEVLGQVRFTHLEKDKKELLESLGYKCPHCGRDLRKETIKAELK